MNKSTLFFICTLSCGIGILLFAIQYEWIVIRFSQPVTSSDLPIKRTKKKAALYYWNANRWHKESQEIFWSTQSEANLEAIIACWLALMDAERITPKKVTLQAAMIAPNNQDAFISFDRSLFAKSWSIEQKWMLIESLLKTVRENGIPINTILFLSDHQPMADAHLDFSCAWPIHGFMQLQ